MNFYQLFYLSANDIIKAHVIASYTLNKGLPINNHMVILTYKNDNIVNEQKLCNCIYTVIQLANY